MSDQTCTDKHFFFLLWLYVFFSLIPVKQTLKTAVLYNRLGVDYRDTTSRVTQLHCFIGIMGCTRQVASERRCPVMFQTVKC